jgi:hypothetical protein
MTGSPTGLAALSRWDVPRFRGGVGSLGVVAGRLPGWRARLDAVSHALARGDWSGPAGAAATAALVELSTLCSAVERALEVCGADLDSAVIDADEAHEFAAAVLAAAAAGGVRLTDEGAPAVAAPEPSAAMAADQLSALAAQHEAQQRALVLAAVAIEAAERVLSRLVAARDALVPPRLVGAPVDAQALVLHLLPIGPVAVPAPPARRAAGNVAAWWSGLTAAQQRAAVRQDPELIGGLDGLPAWARDQANRLLLGAEMRAPSGPRQQDTAQAVYAEIAARERAGEVVQLHQFDLDRDLVGLAMGDLDTATDLAVLVPGILSTPAGDTIGLSAAARRIAAATRAAAPAADVAVLVWLGYRAPGLGTSFLRLAAGRGGPALDRALDGLAAGRAGAPPRTTVVAHSYGTVVLDSAADADGELAADAVVLLGSPGIAEPTAGGLEADEVFDAATRGDPISYAGWFGHDTWEPFWGSTALPVEAGQGHTEYLDDDRPTLAAVGEVVAGTRTP